MTIPSDINTFNGATVAELILGKLDPNVDHLIDVLSTRNSNSLEAPLLEFKGTWRKPQGDTSPDDHHKWNVVKALVALYNAYGGCVLVGLAEGNPDKTQLKLLNCDPDGILDNPKNEWKDLQSHLFTELFKGERGQGLFKTGTDESYQIKNASLDLLKRHVTAHLCFSRRYEGNIIALIVSPLDSNREAIYIDHKAKRKNGSELKEKLLYHRDHLMAESPSIPKSGEMEDPNAWFSYFEERQTILSSTHFKSLLEKAPECPVTPSHMEEEIGRKIHGYYARLSEDFRRLNNLFTPLDAEGAISEGSEDDFDIFRPTAQSFFGFDDDLDERDTPSADEGESENDTSFDEDETGKQDPTDADDKVTVVKDLIELIGENKRLAVIGEPGAGKSTSLCYYALKDWRAKSTVPSLNVYLSLARWQEGGCSVLSLICGATNCDLHEIKYLIDHNRLHLLLDALNECPDHLRNAAVANIQSFIQQFPSAKVTLTSRREDETRSFKLPTFTVQPMGRDQQLRFLGKYLPASPKVPELLDKILSQPGGDSIAANPMLLGMVADIVKKGGTLPRGRATLYQTWLSRWYERECKKAKRASVPLPVESSQEALSILSRIAFVGRLNGYRDIPIQLVESKLQANELTLAKRICEGPLLSIDKDIIHFRHETFQEYLCAEYLVRHKDALDHLAEVDYETWGMPLAYTAELYEGNDLPPALISYASSCSPWLGCIVNHNVKDFPGGTSIPFLIFRSLLASEKPDKDSAILLLSLLSQNRWYTSTGDSPLKYIVTTIPDLRSKWFKFELSTCIFLFTEAKLNHRWDSVKETFFKSTLLLRYRDVVDRINPSKIKPLLAARMIACGFADPSDLTAGTIAQLKGELESPSVEMIAACKAAGLCTEGNLLPFQTANCAQFKKKELILLVNAGIVSREKLRKDLSPQLTSSSAGTLWQYIRAGLLTVNDVKQELDAINEKITQNPLAQKSVTGFIHLTKLNAATHDLTPFYKSHWERLSPDQIRKLIRAGILTGEEIKKNIDKLSARQKKSRRLLQLIETLDVAKNPLVTTPSSIKSSSFQLPSTLRNPEDILTALQVIRNSPIPATVVVNKQTLKTELKLDHVNTPVQSSHHILKNAREGETLQARLKIIPYFGHPGIFVYQAQSVTSTSLCIHEFMQTCDKNRKHPANTDCSADITAPSNHSFQVELQQQEAKSVDTHPEQTSKECLYSISALSHPETRKALRKSLSKQTFVATCAKISKGNALLTHPLFSDPIFLYASSITERPILTGQKWSFSVRAKFSNKKAQGRFLACHATLLNDDGAHPSANPSQTQHDIPTGSLAVDIYQGSVRSISSHALTVYIDETWPGAQDAAYKDIGVIGGIAVAGDGWKNQILPVIRTHMRDYGRAQAITNRMRATPGVFPFVLPVKLEKSPGAAYFELVQHAILLLLGWLLPQRENDTIVDIYLEHISAFNDGHSETEFFNVLKQAMKLLGGNKRFAHWQIRRVEWVPKEFEYVPYADLVCQTYVPLPAQQQFAHDVQVRTWPGFLPFSPNLFPLLRDMDTASPSGFADLLISFARTSRDTPLFKRILRQAVERAQRETPFRDAMLERFESCYEQKDRDIALLNRLTEPFFDAFPPRTFSNSPRMHLLRMLLEMQRANHNGDPEAVNLLVADYEVQRQRLLAIDRELCAYADLNLVVHDHDLFRFEDGLSIANSWIKDPLFPALSLVNRGRMVSSRGQSYALLKRYEDADREFSEAISLFKSEAELYKKEIDQTRVYQCFNLLDLEPSRAVDVIETILHSSLQAAGTDPANTLGNPYHEHLFLKLLWTLRHDLKTTIQDYLNHSTHWPTIHDCHPYELILFYRTLLIFDHDCNAAQNLVRSAEALFERMSYGGTIGLIHSYIRVVFKHMQIGIASDAEFNDELNIVKGYLPAAKSQVALLRRAWEDSSIDISSVLPFNYK